MEEKKLLDRSESIARLNEKTDLWDLIIIGGGATGLGVAVDAATRGLSTLLLEQSDFAKGTSSRSTKLVHGGVRYLAQGDIGLVIDALRERGLLLRNAGHVVSQQSFVIPCFGLWDKLKYGIGLKLYDWLAGRFSFGSSRYLKQKEIIQYLPNLNGNKLKGGIEYFDGQFDDARLAVNLAQTSAIHGGVMLNYFPVRQLLKRNGKVNGVVATDLETGKEYTLYGKSVINATGVFVDDILQMDVKETKQMVRPSQGVHLVFEKSFLNSSSAVMIPKTADGRVLFAVPWQEHVLVGTTDTPLDKHSLEPRALEEEVQFILDTVGQYFSKAPGRKDVLSVFAGLRPLAAPDKDAGDSTKEISRDHKLMVSPSGLVTITGGKWTTYRKMAEETVNRAIETGGLKKTKSITRDLKIHGSVDAKSGTPLSTYGADEVNIRSLINNNPSLGKKLHDKFPYTEAQVIWAVRQEMARTVEDVLARRLRLLFLDAKAAAESAPRVAAILAEELHRDEEWKKKQVADFTTLANQYLLKEDSFNKTKPTNDKLHFVS
jgi:glycerol-3-phosphate dehydrogenase